MEKRLTHAERKFNKKPNLKNKLIDAGLFALAIITLVGATYAISPRSKKIEKNTLPYFSESITKAFSGSCSEKLVDLDIDCSGVYKFTPKIYAREKFSELKENHPERFGEIPIGAGEEYIMNSYDPQKNQLTIPQFGCK